MMKNKQTKIANFLKLGGFLLGFSLLLLNCERDEFITDENIEKEREIDFLTANEIPTSVINILENNKKALNKSRDVESIINYNNVGKVKDKRGNINYTFQLNISETTTFYNLIINENTSNSYVLAYKIDKEYRAEWVKNNYNFSYFKGKALRYNTSSFFNSYNSLKGNNTQGRLLPAVDDCPCSVELIDNGTTSSTGGGGSGSISGGEFTTTECHYEFITFQNPCDGAGNSEDIWTHAHGSVGGCSGSPGPTTVRVEICQDVTTSFRGTAAKVEDDCNPCDSDPADGDTLVMLPRFLTALEITEILGFTEGSEEYKFLEHTDNKIVRIEIGEFLRQNQNPVDNSYTPEAKTFAQQAVEFLINNSQFSFIQYENWFNGSSEGVDFFFDENYWDDASLTFIQQDLPSWDDYFNAYPRNTNGTWLTGADNVFGHVGGDVYQARLDYPNATNNTCALKVSIALNGAGISIPQITTTNGNPGTVKGADGKYYFLNAKALNKWMRKTFGTSPTNPNHYHYTAADGGPNGVNFPSLLSGKKGIYSLVSTNPNWASGHADILLSNTTCAAGCHFADAPIDYIDIWILR